jgi:cysteine-rich repeat protein
MLFLIACCRFDLPPHCGDGTIDDEEECDDGNLASGDGCDRNCTKTGCGNGILTAGEFCDDGNAATCGTCDATCSATRVGRDCPRNAACSTDADCRSGICSIDKVCL